MVNKLYCYYNYECYNEVVICKKRQKTKVEFLKGRIAWKILLEVHERLKL